MPDLGEGTKIATIKQWFVKEGQQVRQVGFKFFNIIQHEDLCEVTTDKTVTRVPSHFDGVVKRLKFRDDEECGVGKVMLEIEIKKESKKKFIDEYGAAVSENMIIPGQFQSQAMQKRAPPSCIQRSDIELFEMATPAVRNLAIKHSLKLS